VLLVQGPLTREDMRLLECVAKAVQRKCELQYKKRSAFIRKGK
jgi:hypothetical protein